jgi:hypothetical protein
VSYTYLTYKWSLAILFLVGLVQSIIQNTMEFMEMEEIENVFKYFIYLTNNGRCANSTSQIQNLKSCFSVQAGCLCGGYSGSCFGHNKVEKRENIRKRYLSRSYDIIHSFFCIIKTRHC